MKKLFVLLCLVCLKPAITFSQIGVPVFVPVQNVTQQNQMWCWAAVTEEILMWKKNSSPKQCDIVSEFNKDIKVNCCESQSTCNSPGTLQQIQIVFNKFGVKYSSMLPLPNARSLYSILAENHAVIMFVQTSRIPGHCIVITGMDDTNVYVNDPTGTYRQSVPLETIFSLWSVAIAV